MLHRSKSVSCVIAMVIFISIFWFNKHLRLPNFHLHSFLPDYKPYVLSNKTTEEKGYDESPATCKWLMLAGDSNARKLFEYIYAQARDRNSFVDDLVMTKVDYKSEKDVRWTDSDYYIRYNDSRCLKISMRFMHGSHDEISRLDKSWSDLRNCVRDCPSKKTIASCQNVFRDSICLKSPVLKVLTDTRSFVTAPQPDFLSFGHGLWGSYHSMHNYKTDPQFCRRRFKVIADKLAQFREQNIALLWVSNPHISAHSRLVNNDLAEETRCMLKHAERLNLPALDLFTYVKKDAKVRMIAGDFHISIYTRLHLSKIFQSIIGMPLVE